MFLPNILSSYPAFNALKWGTDLYSSVVELSYLWVKCDTLGYLYT